MPRKCDLERRSSRERDQERGQGSLFQHWSQGKQLSKENKVSLSCENHTYPSVSKYHEGKDSGLHGEKGESKQGFNNSLLCPTQ